MPERPQRVAEIVLRCSPLERRARARPFLERGAEGGDGLLEPHCAGLALPERPQRSAEIVLRHGPVERHAVPRPFLERGAVGGHRLLKPRRTGLALPERPQRVAEIVLRCSPLERRARARPFLERGAVGGHRLVQPRRASLALPERPQRVAEIVLRSSPLERHAVARPFLERGAEGDDGLLQPRRAGLAFTERLQRVAEIVLRHGPVERHARARPFLERGTKGGDGLLEQRRTGLAFAECRQRIAEIVERGAAFVTPCRVRPAAAGQVDCDLEIEIEALVAAAFVPFVLDDPQRLEQRSAHRQVERGPAFELGGDGSGVAAQIVLLDAGIEERQSLHLHRRLPVLPVADGAVGLRRGPVEFALCRQRGEALEDRVDLVAEIGAARALGGDVAGNLDGLFDFGERLLDGFHMIGATPGDGDDGGFRHAAPVRRQAGKDFQQHGVGVALRGGDALGRGENHGRIGLDRPEVGEHPLCDKRFDPRESRGGLGEDRVGLAEAFGQDCPRIPVRRVARRSGRQPFVELRRDLPGIKAELDQHGRFRNDRRQMALELLEGAIDVIAGKAAFRGMAAMVVRDPGEGVLDDIGKTGLAIATQAGYQRHPAERNRGQRLCHGRCRSGIGARRPRAGRRHAKHLVEIVPDRHRPTPPSCKMRRDGGLFNLGYREIHRRRLSLLPAGERGT